jgi:hypothetical protein
MVVTGGTGENVEVLWYGEMADEIRTTSVPAFCLVEAEIEEADEDGFGRT